MTTFFVTHRRGQKLSMTRRRWLIRKEKSNCYSTNLLWQNWTRENVSQYCFFFSLHLLISSIKHRRMEGKRRTEGNYSLAKFFFQIIFVGKTSGCYHCTGGRGIVKNSSHIACWSNGRWYLDLVGICNTSVSSIDLIGVVVAVVVVVVVVGSRIGSSIVIICIEKFVEKCTIVFHTDNTIISDKTDFDRLYKNE